MVLLTYNLLYFVEGATLSTIIGHDKSDESSFRDFCKGLKNSNLRDFVDVLKISPEIVPIVQDFAKEEWRHENPPAMAFIACEKFLFTVKKYCAADMGAAHETCPWWVFKREFVYNYMFALLVRIQTEGFDDWGWAEARWCSRAARHSLFILCGNEVDYRYQDKDKQITVEEARARLNIVPMADIVTVVCNVAREKIVERDGTLDERSIDSCRHNNVTNYNHDARSCPCLHEIRQNCPGSEIVSIHKLGLHEGQD